MKIDKPIYNSYKVTDWIWAGEYPGDRNDDVAKEKLRQFKAFGITHFIDLTEEGELKPYKPLLGSGMNHLRFPIRDQYIPKDTNSVRQLLDEIIKIHNEDENVKFYIHCWGGVGRTGTIVGCFLGYYNKLNADDAIKELARLFEDCPKSASRISPENSDQFEFIRKFIKNEKMNRRFTPERITSLAENEIFIFGSNLAGAHGGGAARIAYEKFGAVWGQGVGLQGQSYAIPTMQGGVETIKPYVDDFIRFAKENTHLTFLVTRIGCGIAGFRDEEIAPLFKEALNLGNVVLPKEFVECLEKFCNPPRNITLANMIRGSLIGGAVGDALGYPIEFMSLASIKNKYGEDGVTDFGLYGHYKALVSDDTQMTLFTANGLLFGITRWATHGMLTDLPSYVKEAYKEWYQTQTGVDNYYAYHTCWIRDIKELNVQRAPGNTCMSALMNVNDAENDSKGCGGIMRVAPVALYLTAENERFIKRGEKPPFERQRIAKYSGECAAITHKHPLGYISAALFVDVLYQIINTKEKITFDSICRYVDSAFSALKDLYSSDREKAALADLEHISNQAIKLAGKDMPDAYAICALGEGWVAEETWAIALYCVLKYIDSFEKAIIASVNHDGDSDSTGSVCGNLMGAIVGYDAIPDKYKEHVELKDVILALAGDMIHGCNISEYHGATTMDEKQWERRYVFANPLVYPSDGMMSFVMSKRFNVKDEARRAIEAQNIEKQYSCADTLEQKAENCMRYALKIFDNEKFDPNGELVFTMETKHLFLTKDFNPAYPDQAFWSNRIIRFRIACFKEYEPIIALRYDKRWNDFDLAKPVSGIMRLYDKGLETLYPDGGWQYYMIDKSAVSPDGYAVLEILLEKEFLLDVAVLGSEKKLHRIYCFNY